MTILNVYICWADHPSILAPQTLHLPFPLPLQKKITVPDEKDYHKCDAELSLYDCLHRDWVVGWNFGIHLI